MTDYKTLLEKQKAIQIELDELSKQSKEKWTKWYTLEKEIMDNFVKEKKYIPLSEIGKYVTDGERVIKEITLVLIDGTREECYHSYDIEWRENYGIISGVADDGYSFSIKNEAILGFYDLKLVTSKDYITETTRDYLIGVDKGE